MKDLRQLTSTNSSNFGSFLCFGVVVSLGFFLLFFFDLLFRFLLFSLLLSLFFFLQFLVLFSLFLLVQKATEEAFAVAARAGSA